MLKRLKVEVVTMYRVGSTNFHYPSHDEALENAAILAVADALNANGFVGVSALAAGVVRTAKPISEILSEYVGSKEVVDALDKMEAEAAPNTYAEPAVPDTEDGDCPF